MKKIFAIAVSALLLTPVVASAAPEAGQGSFTLSGTGASDKNFDGNAFGVSTEIGKYASDQLLWGVRQSVNGSAGEEVKDSWNGSTRVFADYHFGTGDLRPYVGANIGAIYGQGVTDTGTAGIDLGLKYYVKSDTFIALGTEYQFLFDDGDDKIDTAYNDGAFFYTLGIGFNF